MLTIKRGKRGDKRIWWVGAKETRHIFKAIINCPECTTDISIRSEHTINNTGHVHPSLVCPVCDFHEFVKLEDWEGVDNEITRDRRRSNTTGTD